ncbi:hypothetical protein ACFSAH_02115, partial [Pseudopedobacter beijingensis]
MKMIQKLRFSMLLICAMLLSISSYAQFPYVNSFKKSDATGIVLGGSPSAYLTSGVVGGDPVNDGYLRLTNAVNTQTGYAYIDTPFPSEKGITVEFEYFSHGTTVTNNAPGADGISFFLFDAAISPVEQGRFGGSLGYAQYRNPNSIGDTRNGPGMNGGFLAIGLDEYGNWATQTEDRNGGIKNALGNVITAGQIQGNGVIAIRGAIDPLDPNGDGGRSGAGAYPFIDGRLTNNLGGGGVERQPASSYLLPAGDRFSISTNARGPLQTDANYRKVIIDIEKNSPHIPNSGFTINVKVYVGSLGKTVDVLKNVHYAIDDVNIPQNLKAGFASSTGNSLNIHEIRNLEVNAGIIRAISLVKAVTSTTPVGGYVLGSTIEYTFKVKNEGTVVLDNVLLTDDITGVNPVLVAASDIGGDNKLSPNEEWTYTATYTIQQTDVTAGKVANTAKVRATDPLNNNVEDKSGTDVDNDDPTETQIAKPGKVTLVKTASTAPAGGFKLGDVITYSFIVKNEGTVILNDIRIEDNDLPGLSAFSPAFNAATTLAPGANMTFTATYTIKQTDVDAGKVVNTAKVKAKDPLNNDVEDKSGTATTNDDPTETPVVQTSKITLVKTASAAPTGGFKLGNVITYTFKVKNEGTVTLSNVSLTDDIVGITPVFVAASDIGGDNKLSPDEEWTYTATYTIQQTDVDAGKAVNTAKVIAKDPLNNDVEDKSGTATTNDDPTETPVVQTSKITLVKTASAAPTGGFKLGNVITYTFKVKNEGTVTLSNVSLTDDIVGITPVFVA